MNANQLELIRERLASGQPVHPATVAALCDEVERLRREKEDLEIENAQLEYDLDNEMSDP